jgi:hypothetical protein
MKLGVVIVFNNYQETKFADRFIREIGRFTQVDYCLVINNKLDFPESLIEITEQCSNTSVIKINGVKSQNSAVRAGARYLSSHSNLSQIGFIVNVKGDRLLEMIQQLLKHQNKVFKSVSMQQDNKKNKQTLFQRLFSIPECLNDLGIEV